MKHIVRLEAGVGGFAEDKDEAKRLRVETILPAIREGGSIVLDFSAVKYSTQSFVHALVGEVLQRYKEPVLDKLEFRACAPQVKSLVQLVVDYSLGGFSSDSSNAMDISKPIFKRPTSRGKTGRTRRRG
jgi:STAS-like domain of unknown function (DUF4325)